MNVPVWEWDDWIDHNGKNKSQQAMGMLFFKDSHVFCIPPQNDFRFVDHTTISLLQDDQKAGYEQRAVHGVPLMRKWA